MKRGFYLLLLWTLGCAPVVDTTAQARRKGRAKEQVRNLRDAENYFVDGMKFYVIENYDRALNNFQKAIGLSPTNPAIHYQIARTYANLGDLDAALNSAREALSITSDNEYYFVLVAQLQEQQGDLNGAANTYEQLLARFPEEGTYYLPLAGVYLRQGNLKRALGTYDRAAAFYGVNEEMILQKQQIYLRQNNLDAAVAEGELLIEAFPEEPRHVLRLAEMLLTNGRAEEAIARLEKLVEDQPTVNDARLLLSQAYRSRGEADASLRELETSFADPAVNIDEKVRILVGYLQEVQEGRNQKEALELARLTRQAHPQDPKAHAIYGDLLSMADRREEARESYLRATQLDNTRFAVWQQIVAIDLEMQQFDSLAAHTEAALELFPNQPAFWYYNGVSNYFQQDYRRASRALEAGRKLVVNNNELLLRFYAQLGDTYHELRDHEKSDAAYEAALRLDPSNATVLNNYSYYLSLRREKLDLARQLGQKLVSENPDNPTFLDTYGWVLYAAEAYEEAARYLAQAAAGSDNGVILEHYGDVLYQLGRHEEAVEQWRLAKEAGGELTNLIDRKIADRKLYE